MGRYAGAAGWEVIVTLILFAAMCAQWTFAAYRWLDTAEGRAKLAEYEATAL